MLYAILCYNSEDAVGSWSKEHHDTVMGDLRKVQDGLEREGRLGPVARLLPTTAATTLRKCRENLVIDGPFAETKELVAGFWLWQVRSLEEAIEWVKRCPNPMPGASDIEIRPLYEEADFAEWDPQCEWREKEAKLREQISDKAN